MLAQDPINIRKIIDFGLTPTNGASGAQNQMLLTTDSRRPGKIVLPMDWFPMRNPGQQKMVDQYLGILEKKLGLEVWRVSLEQEWSNSGPLELKSKTLQEYLEMVNMTGSSSETGG